MLLDLNAKKVAPCGTATPIDLATTASLFAIISSAQWRIQEGGGAWGTPKLHKEGKKTLCTCARMAGVLVLYSYTDPPPFPKSCICHSQPSEAVHINDIILQGGVGSSFQRPDITKSRCITKHDKGEGESEMLKKK